MPIQNSGSISLLDIANEFGGTAPHSLSEYYGAASGIPASGAIQLDDFYGASAAFTYTLNSNTQQANIRTLAVDGGWDGATALIFVINTNVVVWSDNTSIAALTTGTNFPNGLTIVNKGKIMGRGGNADSGAFYAIGSFVGDEVSRPGQAGGPAIELNVPVTIDNSQGYIGGGGGGGGGLYGGGGAGGGLAPYNGSFTGATSNENTSATYTLSGNTAQVPLNTNGTQLSSNAQNDSYTAIVLQAYVTPSTGGGNGGAVGMGDFFI